MFYLFLIFLDHERTDTEGGWFSICELYLAAAGESAVLALDHQARRLSVINLIYG